MPTTMVRWNHHVVGLVRFWIVILLWAGTTTTNLCNADANVPSNNHRNQPPPVPPSRNPVIATNSNVNPIKNDNSNGNNNNSPQDGFVQVLETEVWDASENSWKANSGGRWTNEEGGYSLSPSEVEPPEGFQFVGDWKIVVTSGDSMGWEYQFQYLRPPKRRRIWLRSLRQRQVPEKVVAAAAAEVIQEEKKEEETQKQQQQQQQEATAVAPSKQQQQKAAVAASKRKVGAISKIIAAIQDDYNFKGFGLSFYKSLIFPSSFGFALRLPLTTNFGFWDSHPELPSISSSLGFYFPWTVGAFLAASVHVEWVKWVMKHILSLIPRLGIVILYQAILPVVWMVVSFLLFPIKYKLPAIPKPPAMTIPKPRYNPEVSERIGCTVSYRWSAKRGLEWRLSYWHSYLPTLAVYRRLFLSTPKTTVDWWQKHFGALGFSTGYPIPSPPYVSCSACLSLSGLYFQKASSMIENSMRVTSTTTHKTLAGSSSSSRNSSKSSKSSSNESTSSKPADRDKKELDAQLREPRVPPPPPRVIAKNREPAS